MFTITRRGIKTGKPVVLGHSRAWRRAGRAGRGRAGSALARGDAGGQRRRRSPLRVPRPDRQHSKKEGAAHWDTSRLRPTLHVHSSTGQTPKTSSAFWQLTTPLSFLLHHLRRSSGPKPGSGVSPHFSLPRTGPHQQAQPAPAPAHRTPQHSPPCVGGSE